MQAEQSTQRPSRAGRIGDKALTVIGVLGMSLVLATSFHLDGPADYSAEWSKAEYLIELQDAAKAQHRIELAGQAACEDLRGYNTTARFDAAGTLYCAGGQTVVKASL